MLTVHSEELHGSKELWRKVYIYIYITLLKIIKNKIHLSSFCMELHPFPFSRGTFFTILSNLAANALRPCRSPNDIHIDPVRQSIFATP